MDDTLDRLVKVTRHPIRVLAMLCASLCLVVTFASGTGLFGTALGVLAGLLVGELLGWSKVRIPAALSSLGVVLAMGWLTSSFIVGSRIVPAVFGPAFSLHLSSFVWFGLLFFSVVAGLRMVAARIPAWVVVELSAMAISFAAAFAAHRNGAIARPLWLSDRAWRLGIDPANVLLSMGAVFAVLLAVILLLESKRRMTALSAAVLPLLAFLVISLVDVSDLQQPPDAAELAEIQSAMGDPPKPTPPDGIGGGDGEDPDDPQQDDGLGDGEEGDEAEGGGDGGEPQEAQPEGGEGEGTADAGDPEDGEGGGAQDAGESDDGSQGGQEETESAEGAEGQDQQDEGGEGSDQGEQQESSSDAAEGEEGESDNPPPKPPDMSEEQDNNSDGPAQPVAIVLLGDDHTPPSGAFYLRSMVQSEFVGNRLVESMKDEIDRDVLGYFPARAEMVKDPPPEDGRELIHGKVAMLVEHPEPFALEAPLRYEPARNPNPQRFTNAYLFESMAQTLPYEEMFGLPVGNPDWSQETWDHYLDHPVDERYFELADEILADLPEEVREDPFTQALATKVWLDKNVKYSQKEKHKGVDDPTADFLFGNRIGYCVHNAHAAVYLWRTMGIPARVGTGYMVDESGRRGSSLIVTNKDGHAWPELYIDGVGWVILDVSPSENLDPPGQPLDEDMADILSDMARMDEIAEAVTPRDYSWLRAALKYTALGTLLGVLTVVLALHWAVKLWRRFRIYLAGPSTVPRVYYRYSLDLLSEVGLVRDVGETRERFARRVADEVPGFAEVTRLHLAATLGNPERPIDERGEFDRGTWRTALRQLQRELAGSTPFWLRTLGMFNPFSFYRSR